MRQSFTSADDAPVKNIAWKQSAASGFEVLTLQECLKRRRRVHEDALADPQRLEFHMLLLFTRGTGIHMVDFIDYECSKNTLLHVSPNQIHAFKHPSTSRAMQLVFRPEILPVDFFDIGSNATPPAEYLWPSATTLDKGQAAFGKQLFLLLTKQQMSPGRWRQTLTARHLAVSIASFAYRTAATQRENATAINPLFFSFLSLLQENFRAERDANWYAKSLGCSYRTLCRVCRSASGKTPKTLHDERVFTEARRMLAFSDDAVYAIAEELGFTESTNFVKFFQRMSNDTPESFRRNWRGRQ